MAIKERLELKGRCEGWLQPSNIRAIHQYQRHSRLEGTCRWIWTNPKFVKWHEQSSSQASESDRLLCIYGPHGCGKSALASFIAEELERKPLPVLFYSFSGMDTDRQNIDGLIRTFLWQLLQDSSDNTRLDVVQNLMLKGPPATSELWEALKRVLSFIQEDVYCIIDGIDECGDSTTALLKDICDLLRTHMKFRATLLGRPRGLQTVMTTSVSIEMNSEVVKQDIEKFINVKLGESKVLGAPDLRDAVFETLQTKSDGMFLWVKLMMDDLSRSATPFDIRERLRNLPRGLEKTYQLLLLRLIERLDRFDLQLARRILAFTAVSCRTLDLEEVRYACALDSQSSSTNATLHDHLLPWPEQSILDVCGDFITITDGLVRLVHFSVKEFFTRPGSEWLGKDDRGISSFRIDVEYSHRNLASICVRYLSMGDYGSPLNDATAYEEVTSQHPFLKYASMYMISHFSHSGRPCPTTLIELRNFLQSQNCASWIEYVGMILLESGCMDMQQEGFGRFVLWLGEAGGYEVELMLNEFKMFLNQELAKRVREFGEHDPRTEQWQSFIYIFFAEAYDCVAAQQSDSNSNNPAVLELSRLAPSTTLQSLVQIFDGLNDHSMLPLRRQADILLRLQSHLLKVKILTDPLKLLFRIILQNVSIIHLYGLLAIADFYQRVDKLDEALEVYNAALSKAESQEVSNKVAILGLIGHILSQQQKYEEAEAVIRRALKEDEMVYGREHKMTLTVADRLAWILYRQHKFTEAEDLHRRALVGREKVLGAEHANTQSSVYGLAFALYAQHRFAEAEDLYRRVLVGREKVLGAEHKDTLHSVYSLARTLYKQDRFAEAEDLHRRALVGTEKVLGAEHANTQSSVYGLALALYAQHRFAEAEDLYRRALVGMEKVLGAEHANTLNIVYGLAFALYEQHKFAEAEILHRRVLVGMETVLGAEHANTLSSVYGLACALYEQHKFAEAEILHRRALVGREKVLGAEHVNTLSSVYGLALALYEQHKFAEAEALHRRALVGREKVLGAEHMETLDSVYSLACALYNKDKFAEAEVLHRRALVGTEKVLGAEHVETLHSVYSLAWTLYNQAKFAEAEDLHRRALVGREKVLGAEHANTLSSVSSLAMALYEQDKFAEAEDLHRRALVGREKVLGAEHVHTLHSVKSLALALYEQDKFVEAEELLWGSSNTERGNLAQSIEIH